MQLLWNYFKRRPTFMLFWMLCLNKSHIGTKSLGFDGLKKVTKTPNIFILVRN